MMPAFGAAQLSTFPLPAAGSRLPSCCLVLLLSFPQLWDSLPPPFWAPQRGSGEPLTQKGLLGSPAASVLSNITTLLEFSASCSFMQTGREVSTFSFHDI